MFRNATCQMKLKLSDMHSPHPSQRLLPEVLQDGMQAFRRLGCFRIVFRQL